MHYSSAKQALILQKNNMLARKAMRIIGVLL
jgi:hypothetical protein